MKENTAERQATISAVDGFSLAASLYEPGERANGSVIIVSAATAAPRGFYRAYATFLRDAGYTAITYDYRGIGQSRPQTLKGFQARMREWVELDMAGVIEWASSHYRPARLFHVGHSIGGQAAGLLPNHDKISAMVTMSAQSGYWAIHPSPEKYRIWFSVFLMIPTLTRLLGYFPWKRLAGAEDLPRGVALEWAYWCRLPNYLLGDKSLASLERFPHFTAPILAYSIGDDVWGTERSVNAMMAAYTGATVERRHVSPAGIGVDALGHFGFFRPKAKALWEETVAWLGGVAAVRI
ncbi:MAG: alpha/beta fold hydrolase [Chloroflexi bacterium]|nr:alpha/beta fold hydrolase [Chloroflexota bacterium]MCI0575156.1 alpha/beta fold hydrolase [Chloroflexota bacterium]MCI0647162.1 alpha/beta fold hydrolase [Chloroflexota bacterium]MCI0729962.1 alpha/beta fold hydrolase [Chloroflexota bacterium]